MSPMAAAMSLTEPPRIGLDSVPPVLLTSLSLFSIIMNAIRPVDFIKIYIRPVGEDSNPPDCTIGNINLFGYGDETIDSGNVVTAGTDLGLRVLGGVLKDKC